MPDKRSVVAVVDDDSSVRAALFDLLESAGYEPRLFHSGEAFLMSDAPAVSDVVITDIQMDELDGLTLMRRLKASSSKALPVIVVTAWASDELQRQASALGCHAFFSKPFDSTALLEQVLVATKT